MSGRTLRQGFWFLVTGVTNTAITYGAYLMLAMTLPYPVAYGLSYAGGVGLSYWLNAVFVFRVRTHLRSFFFFPLVYVIQYLISAVAMWLLVEKLMVPKEVAPLIIVTITIPLTFLSSRAVLTLHAGDDKIKYGKSALKSCIKIFTKTNQ